MRQIDGSMLASDGYPPEKVEEIEDALERHVFAGRGICDQVTVEEIRDLVSLLPTEERPLNV